MGQLNYSTECGPDGTTIVTLTATNTAQVTIDGIDPGDDYSIVAGPGTHVAVWWKPGTTERIPENVWGSATVTVPALTDCVATPTTLATPPTAPTDGAAATTTVPAFLPAPVPSSTISPAIDLDISVCTETPELCLGTAQPPVPPTLPATGWGDSALGLGGSVLLLAGVTLALVARRRGTTQPTVAEPSSNVTRVRPSSGPFDWEQGK